MRESCVTPVRATLRGVRRILGCYFGIALCTAPLAVAAQQPPLDGVGPSSGFAGVQSGGPNAAATALKPSSTASSASTTASGSPATATPPAEASAAQGSNEAATADSKAGNEADTRYHAGIAAIRQEDFTAAVANLDAAYRAEPQPLTMYALAFAYNGLGYPEKAVEALSAYVDLAVPAGHNPALIAEVQREIARLLTGVARFTVRMSPEDLALRIDDQAIQPKDGQVWLQPGRHEIAASAPGFEPFEQGLEVREGRFELDIQLRPLPAPAAHVAAALCAEGDELEAQGDLLAAGDCYDRARALHPTPRADGSAGLARAQLGEVAVALPLLRSALAVPGDAWVSTHRAALRSAASRAEQRVGTVVLSGDAALTGARVWVDGRSVGRLPAAVGKPLLVAAGSVSIRAALSGHREFRREVQVAPGEERSVALNFTPAPTEPLTLSLNPQTKPVATGAAVAEATPHAAKEPIAQVPAHEERLATGLEMSLELGYDFALRDGLGGSSGSVAARLFSIGYRPFWPVSVGAHLLTGGINVAHEGTQFIGAMYPGFYLRAHSQRVRRSLAIDVWGGVGFVPLAMGLVLHESRDQGVTNLDASQVDDADDVINSVAKDGIGVSDVVTLQSFNIPLELGVSFYLTPGMALSLSSALSFYRPVQQCYFLELSGDHVCYDSGLPAQTSLYIGFGLSLLP